MAMLRSLSLILAITLLAQPAGAAESSGIQLSAADHQALQTVACQQPHGVDIHAVQAQAYGSGAQALVSAEVWCMAHARFNGEQVHYVAQCTRGNSDWNCQGHWQQLQVQTGAELLPVRVEGDLLLMRASQSVRAIANAGTFQGRSLPAVLAPPCYVHQGNGREFIDVKCSGWHIIVSTWCPQDDICPRVMSLSKSGAE